MCLKSKFKKFLSGEAYFIHITKIVVNVLQKKVLAKMSLCLNLVVALAIQKVDEVCLHVYNKNLLKLKNKEQQIISGSI